MAKQETVGFDFDLMAELAEEAPVQGGNFSFTNFGKLSASNWTAVHWDNDSKSFVKRDYVPGTPLETGEYVQFDLNMDIKELNPSLTFDKAWRFIAIRQSGKRSKDKTDWSEIIVPSIVETFGGSEKEALKKFFQAIVKGTTYFAVEDFITGRVNKKEYDITAPKLVKVFKNKAECENYKAELYTKSDEAVSSNGSIPEQFVGQVRAMLKNNDPATVTTIIESAPEAFGGYSASDLITAADKQPPF